MTWISSRTAGVAVALFTLGSAAAGAAFSATAEPAPRDAASGIAAGKRMHKPYNVTAEKSASCGAPAKLSSDPEEGGQVSAANSGTGWDVKKNVKTGVASDPEEGGQLTARSTSQPHVSDMSVTKHIDSASTKPMGSSASDTCPPSEH